MANLSDKLSGLTYTPKPLSPMRAGCIVNVASDSVAEWISRNWFECDGSEYPESTYADLFAAIGTKYNTGGETASHFRVPNGPRVANWIDLDLTLANGGTVNQAKGQFSQDSLGDWHLKFNINVTGASSGSTPICDVSGVVFEASYAISGVQGSQNDSVRAFVSNSPPGRINLQFSATYDAFIASGSVRLASKPTDAAVGADSRFSTFDEALEAIPVIKIYNDEGTVSISSAAATASTLGTVKLNSEYAATSSQYGLSKAIKWQKKVLASNVPCSGSLTALPEFNFSGLTEGQTYRLTLQFRAAINNGRAFIIMTNDGNSILQLQIENKSSGSNDEPTTSGSTIFVADATTIVASQNGTNSSQIIQSGNQYTFAILEEYPNHEETTDFT